MIILSCFWTNSKYPCLLWFSIFITYICKSRPTCFYLTSLHLNTNNSHQLNKMKVDWLATKGINKSLSTLSWNNLQSFLVILYCIKKINITIAFQYKRFLNKQNRWIKSFICIKFVIFKQRLKFEATTQV